MLKKLCQRWNFRNLIPKGPYCYTDRLCIHYTYVVDEGVYIPYCRYLEDGDISNINDEDYDKLKLKYPNIDTKYSLLLLWDKCKMCDEKL